MTEKEVIH